MMNSKLYYDFQHTSHKDKLKLDDADIKILQEDDCIVDIDHELMVKYERFLKVGFPDSNPIQREILNQAARKILKSVRSWRAALAHQKKIDANPFIKDKNIEK